MRLAVGSLRGPKVDALRAVLAEIDPHRAWQVETFAVESGVRETPLSRDEIQLGACRRVEQLLNQRPGFDLYVGMEGGPTRAMAPVATSAAAAPFLSRRPSSTRSFARAAASPR